MRERLTVYISDWESGESLSVKWICKLVSGFLCGGTVQRCGNKRSFKPVQSLKGGNTLVTSRKLAKYHDLPQFFFFSLSFINRKYCLLAIMSSFSRPVQSSRFFYRTNKTKQRSSYPGLTLTSIKAEVWSRSSFIDFFNRVSNEFPTPANDVSKTKLEIAITIVFTELF